MIDSDELHRRVKVADDGEDEQRGKFTMVLVCNVTLPSSGLFPPCSGHRGLSLLLSALLSPPSSAFHLDGPSMVRFPGPEICWSIVL